LLAPGKRGPWKFAVYKFEVLYRESLGMKKKDNKIKKKNRGTMGVCEGMRVLTYTQ
jgi:hypothetical protein